MQNDSIQCVWVSCFSPIQTPAASPLMLYSRTKVSNRYSPASPYTKHPISFKANSRKMSRIIHKRKMRDFVRFIKSWGGDISSSHCLPSIIRHTGFKEIFA